MYCPECRVEYRDGFTECSDCRVPLVAGKPPEPEGLEDDSGTGDPNLQLITVLTGSDRLLLGSAKGLLEDAGIPFYAVGDDVRQDRPLGGSFVHPWWAIQVGTDREQEARTALRVFDETGRG